MDLLEVHDKDYVINMNERLFDGAEPLEILATLFELYQVYVIDHAQNGVCLPKDFDTKIGKHIRLITDFLGNMHASGGDED